MRLIKIILIVGILICLDMTLNGQCIQDSHTPFSDSGWMSCQIADSPVAGENPGHWIQYDLGYDYRLLDVELWNHNVWGETGMGVKSISVFYSQDGITWSGGNAYAIEKAPGSWKYNTPEFIDLNGIECRFLLIAVDEIHDASMDCVGIGEIRIQVETTTSIEEVDEIALEIYPNPVADRLYVKMGDLDGQSRVSVTNAIGIVMGEWSVNSLKNGYIDVSGWPEGAYTIALGSQEKARSSQFIKIQH